MVNARYLLAGGVAGLALGFLVAVAYLQTDPDPELLELLGREDYGVLSLEESKGAATLQSYVAVDRAESIDSIHLGFSYQQYTRFPGAGRGFVECTIQVRADNANLYREVRSYSVTPDMEWPHSENHVSRTKQTVEIEVPLDAIERLHGAVTIYGEANCVSQTSEQGRQIIILILGPLRVEV